MQAGKSLRNRSDAIEEAEMLANYAKEEFVCAQERSTDIDDRASEATKRATESNKHISETTDCGKAQKWRKKILKGRIEVLKHGVFRVEISGTSEY